MTEPSQTPVATNWWQRRSRRAKAAIVVAGVVLIVPALASEPADDASAKRVKAAPAKPVAPSDPVAALTNDVRKNLRDQYGKKSVKAVECSSTKAEPMMCIVDVRVHAFRDRDGLIREMGGGLHELFRDTTVQYLKLNALSDTLDGLGNEQVDDQVGFVLISRDGWAKVDWDNLQYQNPIALREVSDSLAITVKF